MNVYFFLLINYYSHFILLIYIELNVKVRGFKNNHLILVMYLIEIFIGVNYIYDNYN